VVDGILPTSQLFIAPGTGGNYQVSWEVTGIDSGLANVVILYKTVVSDSYTEAYAIPLNGASSGTFDVNVTGVPFTEGTTYYFASRATDNAGNIETDIPDLGDANFTYSSVNDETDSGGGGGGGGGCFLSIFNYEF